jgi:hypothetical protein
MPRKKTWILINKGSKRTKASDARRQADIEDNQLASKILWEELYKKNPTLQSELIIYRKDDRGDGNDFTPRRSSIESVRDLFFPACFDEGDAFSTYAAENIYEEGDATDQIPEQVWNEGDAGFNLYSCDLAAASTSSTLQQPIQAISVNATLDKERYYRITGGTVFTITEASDVFNALSPFSMTIKNASGGSITINRSGSDTFYEIGGTDTSFVMADGDVATLIATTSSNWDVTLN